MDSIVSLYYYQVSPVYNEEGVDSSKAYVEGGYEFRVDMNGRLREIRYNGFLNTIRQNYDSLWLNYDKGCNGVVQ